MQIEKIRPQDWDQGRLHQALDGIRQNRLAQPILVLGDVGVDRYTIGSVERISPEAPVPIVAVEEEKLKLGLAANVAENICALGGIPFLAGVIGEDRGAEDLRRLLKENQISSEFLVTDPNRRTVLKERVVSEKQQLLRIDYEHRHPLDPRIEARVFQMVEKAVHSSSAVVIEDYSKGLLSERLIQFATSLARSQKKWVAVDPNSKTPVHYYKGATVLTPNTKEAEALSGIPIRDLKALIEAGQQILEKTEAQYVVITRGKDGMSIFDKEARRVSLIPTYAKEVYDVSGAGDTVIATLVLALASGATIEEASILGNLAAGIEIGKRGTATVSVDEIQEAFSLFEHS